MNIDYSYVGVPATTREVIAKEGHDHPTEPSETHTLSGPEAPEALKLSTPMLEWKPLITPIGTLVLGGVLALGHHAFNAWEDGKHVYTHESVVPQRWVTRIGVGFSFGFKSAVGVTMVFVLLQCLWHSVIHQPLTIQQIDTMYQIERQDQLYKTLPKALFFSPTIVVFSILTLLLPLTGVFPPGSLTVTNNTFTNFGPCTIPTGNLSARKTPDSLSLFTINNNLIEATPRAKALTTRWLVEQSIPDLPQACGSNCRYKAHIPSFIFQCKPNPSLALPSLTLWNGTTDPHLMYGFNIAWRSNGPNGTQGTASCTPVQAQYDVEVQTKGGIQSVRTNVTQIMSPIESASYNISGHNDHLLNQLAAISYATWAPLLGQAVLLHTDPFSYQNDTIFTTSFADSRPVFQPSFLEIRLGDDIYPEFVWGDVLKGIEEMSHNVTAALLTLNLETMNASCSFDHQAVVYQYTPFALWIPYGMALGVALISLVIAIMVMTKNNTGDITTSFSNTVILTRNVNEEFSGRVRLRLRAVEDGKLEYTLE